MLIAIFLLGNETNMINYTLSSIHNAMNLLENSLRRPFKSTLPIFKYITFGCTNDDSNIFTNNHQICYDLMDLGTHFQKCQDMLSTYEQSRIVKFDKIFLIRTNTLFGNIDHLTASGGLNNINQRYISSIKNSHKLFDLREEDIVHIDSILLSSENYYEIPDNLTASGGLNDSPSGFRAVNIDTEQIPQEYLSGLFHNVWHYDKILKIGGADQKGSIQINVTNKTVFAVTSVVNIKSHDSKWSPSERLEQVIQTLISIKKYVPEAVTFLLEGSTLNINQINRLRKYTDYLLLFNDEKYKGHVNFYNKSKFEIYGFIDLLERIKDFKWFCKLGGRYRLTGDFKKEQFLGENPSFFYSTVMNSYNYSQPVLYSIPHEHVSKYVDHLKSMNYDFHNIEYILYCYTNRTGTKINFINDKESLWATGFPASSLRLIKS